MTVEITPLEKGCELKLTQDVPREFAEGATEGWSGLFDALARTIA